MTGNRMCAFALSTAFVIICCAPPVSAAQFDGNWSMLAVTTSGHCGRIPIGLGISHGRIFLLVDVLLATRFSWSAAFSLPGRSG